MRKLLIILLILLNGTMFAQKKAEKQVYIIHGYGATIDNHWFKWLDNELSKRKIKVFRVAMPTPNNPKAEEWLAQMKKKVKINSETVIVAHSLGTITTLNFLAETQQSVKGTVLVSGFYKPFSDEFAILNPFMEKFAQRKNEPKVGQAVVISSLDDTIVPQQMSDDLSKLLKCKFIRLPKGGHFLDREGFTTFPLVLEEVLKIFNVKTK